MRIILWIIAFLAFIGLLLYLYLSVYPLRRTGQTTTQDVATGPGYLYESYPQTRYYNINDYSNSTRIDRFSRGASRSEYNSGSTLDYSGPAGPPHYTDAAAGPPRYTDAAVGPPVYQGAAGTPTYEGAAGPPQYTGPAGTPQYYR